MNHERLREVAWRRGLEDGFFGYPENPPEGFQAQYVRGRTAAERAKVILAQRVATPITVPLDHCMPGERA
jgi:hypothetical protein